VKPAPAEHRAHVRVPHRRRVPARVLDINPWARRPRLLMRHPYGQRRPAQSSRSNFSGCATDCGRRCSTTIGVVRQRRTLPGRQDRSGGQGRHAGGLGDKQESRQAPRGVHALRKSILPRSTRAMRSSTTTATVKQDRARIEVLVDSMGHSGGGEKHRGCERRILRERKLRRRRRAGGDGRGGIPEHTPRGGRRHRHGGTPEATRRALVSPVKLLSSVP